MLRTADLTADQLADLHDVDPATVRRWTTDRHDPPCPHRKDGRGRLRFNAEAVDQWLHQTGVLKRSLAQRPAPDPGPPVAITNALAWPIEQVEGADLSDEQRKAKATTNTLRVATFCCKHNPEMPDPPDVNLDSEQARGEALEWFDAIPHRTVGEWRALCRKALASVNNG